jgi:hypothetical protein
MRQVSDFPALQPPAGPFLKRPRLWWQMPTNLPPRRQPPHPRRPMLPDAAFALSFAVITVGAADFLLWLTSLWLTS